MKKLPPGEWNLGMERTLRSWTNTTHSAMRGIFESSLVVEPLETPLGHNKLKVGAGWRCCHVTDPREPPLGFNEMRDEAGLGWGCGTELTGSGKYGPDRSPGYYVDHDASGKCRFD
ncbi:hypothetical protein V6N13_048052 [Hibiscus sabdariffa]